MIQINIDYAADDSGHMQLWAKGHHPVDKFTEACKKKLVDWDGREVSLSNEAVQYKHWRTVKANAETRAYGVVEYVHQESKPGRGAYPVTVLMLDEWLPIYSI